MNVDPTLEANKTILAPAVEKILKVPDYKAFQKEIEGVVRKSTQSLVASNFDTSGATRRRPLTSWRVSGYFFDHTFVQTQHDILFSDLAGNCPENAPSCIAGPKWSPNGRSKA
jgi:hypothetical protein